MAFICLWTINKRNLFLCTQALPEPTLGHSKWSTEIWLVAILVSSRRPRLLSVICRGSASCEGLKSSALPCYGSRHWSAAAAGFQTSPGRAGGWWLVCGGRRAASSAAEASAERLLWRDQQNNHATTFTWQHIQLRFLSFFHFLGF